MKDDDGGGGRKEERTRHKARIDLCLQSRLKKIQIYRGCFVFVCTLLPLLLFVIYLHLHEFYFKQVGGTIMSIEFPHWQ